MFTRHYAVWPPGLPKTLSVPRTSLYFNLQVSAKRYPDKAAIHYYGGDLSYARLDAEVCALAAYLQQRCGVKKGDRVLLYLQNSPQFVIADLRYGAGWDFGNRGALVDNLRAALSLGSAPGS